MIENAIKTLKPGDEENVAVPINWVTPEGLKSLYANLAVVQLGEAECYLSFYEAIPPPLIGTPDQVQEQAAKLTTIAATCVARIAVTKEVAAKFARAIQATGLTQIPGHS